MKPGYAAIFEQLTRSMEHETNLIDLFLTMVPSGSIAEIGAGHGRLVPFFSDREVFYIENDEDMVARLAERFPNIVNSIVKRSAWNTKIPTGSVAAAHFSPNAICEMQPVYFCLSEASRIVSDDGVILFTATNPLTNMPHAYTKFREVACDDYVETSHVITYPTPTHGPNWFETKITLRNMEGETTVIVSQVLPKPEYWIKIMSNMGFILELATENRSLQAADLSSSKLISYFFRKKADLEASPGPVQRVYDLIAPTYNQFSRNAKERSTNWFKQSLKSESPPKFSRFLDLACGTGKIGAVIREYDSAAKVFGLDFSAEMVTIATNTGYFAAVACADLNDGIPLVEDGFFDYISGISFMEFIADPVKILKDIQRLLAHHGKAWITFELRTETSPTPGVPNPKTGLSFYSYTTDDIRGMIAQAGLKLNDLTTGFGYEAQLDSRHVEYIYCEVAK
ncbi:MAG: methyltransferase domain-containing protein [Pseudomonadota bacterium]